MAKTVRLVIPGPSTPFKVRNPFIEDLLHMIFSKQGLSLDLQYANEQLTQGRALRELNNEGLIDITWSVSTKERELSLNAIEIPLYQGFIGWRVFVINKEKQPAFSNVSNLTQLRELLAVQRFDWPDYHIFLANDLPVDGSLAFSKMFKAVESGLADYFPRSVLEAKRDIDSVNSSQLGIEKTILLKYPSSYYFFVGKHNSDLAQTIEQGFKLVLADGSYQLLFQQYFGSALEALKIEQRKVFVLDNPLLVK